MSEKKQSEPLKQDAVSGSISNDFLKCPYDVDNQGRCYYPIGKKGNCTCVLRHHTSSKTYSF